MVLEMNKKHFGITIFSLLAIVAGYIVFKTFKEMDFDWDLQEDFDFEDNDSD